MTALKIAIDARLPDHGQGGVQQVICTLALGLKQVPEIDCSVYWVVLKGTSWWKSVLPENDVILEVPAPFGRISIWFAHRFPGFTSRVFPLLSLLLKQSPPYDQLLNQLGIDVVHLPFQDGFKTGIPFVYNPHDLQHHYFPEFFSTSQIRHREKHWRKQATEASVVMAASHNVRNDLTNFWAVAPQNISVVPIPPPDRTGSNQSILDPLPNRFGLYPAAFWRHKNHSRLLQALASLAQNKVRVPLVFVGAAVGDYEIIRASAAKLGLHDSVFFLGHVTDEELTSLIKASDFVIVPSLFEAMSLTVWDAQRLGTPVACSNIDPFPDQVGDSALTFNPMDVHEIASVIKQIWGDAELRTSLSGSGLKRTQNLTSKNYALAMAGEYYRAAGLTAPGICSDAATHLRRVVSR